MDKIITAVQAAQDENPSAFRDAIHDVLAGKVQDALDLKRIDVASSFLNPPAEQEEPVEVEQEIEPVEQEIVPDENIQATA